LLKQHVDADDDFFDIDIDDDDHDDDDDSYRGVHFANHHVSP
jgi:hypothetical protein